MSSFPLEELLKLILKSELSLGKKLAYLYLLLSGSFSRDSLQDLKEELNRINEKTQKRAFILQRKIKETDQKQKKLEQEIAELTPKACEELQGNFDKLVVYVSEEERLKALKNIKAKLAS